MKRILTFIVILSILLFSSNAVGESINVASLSIEDLLSLKSQIETTLALEGVNTGSRIGRGIYLVGRDIKEGTYEFICVECDQGNNYLKIYQSDSSGSDDYDYIAKFIDVGEWASMTLNQGQTFVIEKCSGYLIPITPAWAP